MSMLVPNGRKAIIIAIRFEGTSLPLESPHALTKTLFTFVVVTAFIIFCASDDAAVAPALTHLPCLLSLHQPIISSAPPRYRQKFDQLRSQWEAAQSASKKPSKMVGRKEKQAADPTLNTDWSNDSGSKIRRKLSHGLSFISNPLSHRKPTPGQLQLNRPSLAVSGLSMSENTTTSNEVNHLFSSHHTSTLVDFSGSPKQRTTTPKDDTSSTSSMDTNATPKPLPRCRTMSFIPRPSRSASKSSALEEVTVAKPHPPTITFEPGARVTPSKIPNPSPPIPGRRRSSPRQYIHQHTSQDAKHIAAGMAFARIDDSLSKASVRSHTTPNLVRGPSSTPQSTFMAPRKKMLKNPSASSGLHKATLKENTPTKKRDLQRPSQTQEKHPKRESMMASSTIANRRSFGPNYSLGQGKQIDCVTPQVAKRQNSRLAPQTPPTVERIQKYKQSTLQPTAQSRDSTTSLITQPRLMGPVNPPTLAPIDQAAMRAALPRASTDKDLRRRTIATPTGFLGVGKSARSLAGVCNEVRLPRSSTFHSLWRRDPPPPVPPIPERYQTPSQPILTPHGLTMPDTLRKSLNTILERKACNSILEDVDEGNFPSICSSLFEQGSTRCFSAESFDEDTITALPPMTSAFKRFSSSLSATSPSSGEIGSPRPWSITTRHYADGADVGNGVQVKDYMPALYWAGRFQSRFDQWRTEAMEAELSPDRRPQGPLGQCKLDQEKVAACFIFHQLRDLCVSTRAADSLWEFEYRYRQEHKLLGTNIPPVSQRKQDDNSIPRSGTFGRAVRKLTPRKSSLVNLLKGKGWNRSEDAKPADIPEDEGTESLRQKTLSDGS